MTYTDLLIEIIADTTGKTLEQAAFLLLNTEQGRKIVEAPPKQLTDEEAEEWRKQLINEPSGILAWLTREIMVQQPPQGSA